MAKRRKITRREFLHTTAVAAAGMVAAACAGPMPTPTAEEEAPPAEKEEEPVAEEPGVSPHQAPMLQEMVAAGELLPLNERLPENPFVAEGLDGIGNFGGAWRMNSSGEADTFARGQVVARGLLNVNQDIVVHDYMAESHEVSPDGKEWTFHLRKGTKWSDGEEITAEDFRFWYEDLVLNREYTPAHPKWLASVVDGEVVPAEFEAPDDYTIKYKFAEPNALLHLRGQICRGIPAAPAHFLKPFHIDYGDKDTIETMIAEDDRWDDWTHVLQDKDNSNVTVERPTHEPWINENVWSDEVTTLVRNPYFWEVDTEGNQLPYIDRLQYRNFKDREVALLRIINGEIDCQVRHVGTNFENFTTLMENREKGDYRIVQFPRPWTYNMNFNMTCKDERLRNLFQERDFRIAISHCVNRDEMNELLFEGMGTPRQHTPPKVSPFYYEKFAKAYLEYDPEKSNNLLDGLGHTERDDDGYRLWNDGSGDRVSFVCLGTTPEASDYIMMLIDYLKEIGLEMVYKGVDRSLSIEMHHSNDVQVTAGMVDRASIPLADPQPWTKYTNISDRPWINAWTAWYMDPTLPIAEKPPEDHWIWDIWGYWEEIQRIVDSEKRKQLFFKILDIFVEELPYPSFISDLPVLCPTKNGFMGIKGGYPWDCCIYVYEHIIDNATWYWDKPEEHEL